MPSIDALLDWSDAMQFPHERLSVYQKALTDSEIQPGKELLVRVGQMTARKDYPDR